MVSAVGEAVGGSAAVWSASEAPDLQLHQALCSEADHLAQEVGVCRLLQQVTEVHVLVGHRWVLGWR